MLLTQRVKAAFYHDAMIQTSPNETILSHDHLPESEMSESRSLFNCQAMLVGLKGGRFIVVRLDEASEMAFVNATKKDLRDMDAGDEVIYRGKRSIVQAVDYYC